MILEPFTGNVCNAKCALNGKFQRKIVLSRISDLKVNMCLKRLIQLHPLAIIKVGEL